MENSQPLINSSDDAADYLPHLSNSNGDGESEHNLSAEVVKGALETTASTGKFWNDWEELKSMLYFQLKQVLSEYPEATMSDDEQNSALGESYMQLVKRLEGALFSFIDGPPFTLQRLSEILLDARAIYPNLSKLALALEKNLLVTSTLTKSTDPYPPSTVQSKEQAEDTLPQLQSQIQTHTQPETEPKPEPESESESKPKPEPDSGPLHELSPAPAAAQHKAETEQSDAHPNNGGESMAGDKDEVMTEVDTEDGDGCIGFDSFERVVNAPDTPDSPPLPTFNPDPFSSL